MMSEEDFIDIHLRVLYDFEYVGKDERKIKIQKGEKLFLIKKTNADWWQVIRSSSERPFFVPAAYVQEYSSSQGILKELPQCRSIKRCQEHEIKDSVTSADVKNDSSESLKYEKETSNMNTFCPKECKTSKGHSEKQPDTLQNMNQKSSDMNILSKEDADNILLGKLKSWDVEELAAELSDIRTERNLTESPSTKFDSEKHLNEGSFTSPISHNDCSVVHSSPYDKMCSSKHALSLKSDKVDNSSQRTKGGSQEQSCISVSETYSKVCPVSSRGSRNVEKGTCKLSESLEKLAQEIQFDPNGANGSRNAHSNFSGSFIEPSTVIGSAVDNTKMDSMFSRMKTKLSYSSSFKTKKEMQQVLKRRSGNSVLSTSWENALSEYKGTENNKVIQDENKLRNAGHVLNSLKEQRDSEHHQLKASHSGSDLEVLSQGIVSQKASSQHLNLVHHHVFGDKTKEILHVSGSESEENLDESMGPDEGSISGLSDDNHLCQSGRSKVYSDISDDAVSDDLLSESLGEAGQEQGGDSSSCQKLQRKQVSFSGKNRVGSHCVPPSPSPDHKPVRVLNEGWEEYQSSWGRTYYYNCRTHDKSWKPPRRHHKFHENAEDSSTENLWSDTSSPLVDVSGSNGMNYIPVPPGWREVCDEDSGQLCYVNNATGAKNIMNNCNKVPLLLQLITHLIHVLCGMIVKE